LTRLMVLRNDLNDAPGTRHGQAGNRVKDDHADGLRSTWANIVRCPCRRLENHPDPRQHQSVGRIFPA